VGSRSELSAYATDPSAVPEDLHRPFVDEVRLHCTAEGCSGEMVREVFVVDCWFDSGCASFAQWHHPFEGDGRFQANFPIDYICEGVDQTRGWFYTLLAVSTTVFDSICYRRCLSLGMILDREGKKMSKSRGNIIDPWDHFNREGADATRWYMVTAGAPWNPLKFDPSGVRETYAKMFLTLWNVYRFHADYAALDGFDPDSDSVPAAARPELDRWILSRLGSVAAGYHEQFVCWDFHKAGRDLEDFVVNDLSNWYVRRSRRRLWDDESSADKRACQSTLHEVLITVCRLMAPISPFMADEIHSNLVGESVHLADWPLADAGWLPEVDGTLEDEMALVRSLAEAGRRVRVVAKRRQRLPCREGFIVGGPDLSPYHDLLADELNVEVISTEDDLDRFQRIELAPNRGSLGKKCRQDLPAVVDALTAAEPEATWASIQAGTCTLADYAISEEDVELRRVEKDGFAASTITHGEGEAAADVSRVLDTAITPALASKGLARDIIRRVQQKRKDLSLELEASITLSVWLGEGNPDLSEADWAHVQRETRAGSASLSSGEGPSEADSFSVDDAEVRFTVN